MRLLRAQFENFRLLRDLKIEFSSDETRKLTVIRAANETGKTTILHALQWALYGDTALPGRGDEFRLHPIDWDVVASGSRVPISVSVDFEVVRYNRIAGSLRESRKRYRIVRAVFEELEGKEWRRGASTVRLLQLTESGADPIDMPDAVIHDELPPELREVFFTDGDRALSFIEADVSVSTKRDRVERAIRSLLGLGVVEEGMRHVKKAAAEINKQARQLSGNEELQRVAARLESLTDDVSKLEAQRDDARQQFTSYDVSLAEVDQKIDEVLLKGDRAKLGRELDAARKAISRLDEQSAAATRRHSQLFRGEALGRDLLGVVLEKGFGRLQELHDTGKIPNATIPVLEERLTSQECICGESLRDDGGDGSRRRQHICGLIDASKRADAVQKVITDLFYDAKSLGEDRREEDDGWLAQYKKVADERFSLQNQRDEEGRRLKAIELQIDALPNTDVQELREVQRNYRERRDYFNAQRAKFEAQLDELGRQRGELVAQRDRLLREQTKGARIVSELEVTNDILGVLEKAYEQILNEELEKVSALMNALFLEMIGADPEQGAIIRQAEISREFDIRVLGPEGRLLNPDRDLNGASRRALTLAFILALTKVSEVEAPNVIDTPLGMMSGYVKRAVLKTAIRESAQLVLFLTHSEIVGCEEILDENAGDIFTLTNPAHFPKMLIHDPGVDKLEVLRCGCNHRRQCHICERRQDEQTILEMAS